MFEMPITFVSAERNCDPHLISLFSWEIPGYDASFAARDRFWHQQGEKVEKYTCLSWGKGERKKERLPANFHEIVLELCGDILDFKRFHKLESFWNTYGPLVNLKDKVLPLPAIQNMLLFYRRVTALWDACLIENAEPIIELFNSYTWLYELENLAFQINMGVSRENNIEHKADSLYLYFDRDKPHISMDKAYIFGKEFYLELKNIPIENGRPEINLDPREILKYMRRTLTENINRLTRTWHSSIKFEKNQFRATITPSNLFSAGIFGYIFTRSGQVRDCAGDCGRFSRPGSEYCSDSCRQRTINENRKDTQAGMRDAALSQYRTWKIRKKISAEDYEKIRFYAADAAFSSTEELKKLLEGYRIQEGIHPQKPVKNIPGKP